MEQLKDNNFISLAYADDLAVVGYNKDRLRGAIRLVEDWANRNEIIINKKKSGVMIH